MKRISTKPTVDILKQVMTLRGTITDDEIAKQIKVSKQQLASWIGKLRKQGVDIKEPKKRGTAFQMLAEELGVKPVELPKKPQKADNDGSTGA